MLVGHYGAAYVLRGRQPAVPLYAFFLAVQAPDILFFVLALLGIEHVTIVPGVDGPLAMELTFIPYSHSLVGVVVLAAAVALIVSRVSSRGAGMALGVAVVSHWVGDLVVHMHDLPLVPGLSTRVGFSLWQYSALSLLLEISIVVAAVIWLAKRLQLVGRARTWLYASAAVLALAQVPYMLRPPAQTPDGLSVQAELLYFALAFLAWGVDGRLKRARD